MTSHEPAAASRTKPAGHPFVMTPPAILTILAVVIASSLAGAPSAATVVERSEREWSAAFLRHDVAAIDRLLADDFVGIDGRGVVSNKAAEIEEARLRPTGAAAPTFEVLGETLSDVQVRVYGDTAIVNATNTVKARFNGEDIEPKYRRTTVWVRRRGTWKCVSFHASRIL